MSIRTREEWYDLILTCRNSGLTDYYSLVETAKVNNLNVFSYMETVLTDMPGDKDGSTGIEQLLPWSKYIQKKCAGRSKK